MNLEDMLAQLFNPLGLDQKPGPTDEQKAHFDRVATDQARLCNDAKAVLASAEGHRLFQHLREMTVDNSTWMASMGLINGVAHGFAREGQNSIYRHVEGLAKMADSLNKNEAAKHDKAKEGKKNAGKRK